MKKKYVLFLSLLLIIIVVSLFCVILFKKTKTSGKHNDDKIVNLNAVEKKIDSKDTFFVFITSSDQDNICELEVFKTIKDVYSIKTICVSDVKRNSDDLKTVAKELRLNVNDILIPSTLFILNGNIISITSMMDYKWMEEQILINKIGNNNNNLAYENEIKDDEFNNLYSNNNKSIVLWSSFDENAANNRKKLRELASKNNFTYNVIYNNYKSTMNTSTFLIKKFKEYKYPTLLVVGNNSIIDYKEIKDDKDIDEFLKKNKFIS